MFHMFLSLPVYVSLPQTPRDNLLTISICISGATMSVLSWKRVESPAPLEPIFCARCSFLISVEWESRNVFLIHTHTILIMCLYLCTQVCLLICVCIFLLFIFLSVPQTFFHIHLFVCLSFQIFQLLYIYLSSCAMYATEIFIRHY